MNMLPKPYYHDEQFGIKIFLGDCRTILPYLDPVDLILTDPPYGVNLGEHGGAKETRTGLLVKVGGYEDSPEHFIRVVVPAITTAMGLTNRTMIFCVPPTMWLLPAPDAIGGVFVDGAVGRNKWGWSNLIHCLLYGSAPNLNKGAKPTAIRNNAMAEKTGHPTTKPLKWMRWAVSLGSLANDTILDPFMGSGTTLVAAKQLGRKCIGIEINEAYVKIAIERLRQGVLEL
jgi:site-specific DNA-methyltransferase (adenine-specific)